MDSGNMSRRMDHCILVRLLTDKPMEEEFIFLQMGLIMKGCSETTKLKHMATIVLKI